MSGPIYRLSRPAAADLARILAASEERWGFEARRRYAALLAAAIARAAEEPHGPATRAREEVGRGIRSLHLRHAVGEAGAVRRPVHVVFFRASGSGGIEIVRVLHERMAPSRHLRP